MYQGGLRDRDGPSYLILAKQKNQVYFFTYQSPYRQARGRYFPGNLVRHFAKQEAAFRAAVPDTNRYLLPGIVPPDTLRWHWLRLQPRQLWAIKGDGPNQPAAPNCAVDDGDYNTFFLIDQRAMKSATFYAPAYWEECAGKDPNRQRAIRTRGEFHAILRASQPNVK
ncbi:hypothetical protein [Hymenobacter rubidus]|uniref:hypothetical protein n=1 Tax=Hymenobacter rubidus TaxID=1441626 RepID=UPI00191FAE2A|nr:hypothetical protein [Hymenobacter rubidus]